MSSPDDAGVGSADVAPPPPGPTPAGFGSRVVALVGAIGALLALALPWAREDSTVSVETNFGTATLLQPGGDQWSGWALHGASRLDGHRPVTVAMAMLLITATFVLVGAAWATFERPRAIWVAPTMAGVAVMTLIVSVPGLDGVAGKFGAGHVTTVEFGLAVWRTALAIVAVGAIRLALLQEASRRRLR
ncbi:hypothetical protein ABT369_53395 [Dactylosporangium sp. NPDC000244]|uniref:hypothetical protein n=1 Tax=Dactylosporangium sp. NPDC000244 TaxID=3154365 RepID=UPI00332E08C8